MGLSREYSSSVLKSRQLKNSMAPNIRNILSKINETDNIIKEQKLLKEIYNNEQKMSLKHYSMVKLRSDKKDDGKRVKLERSKSFVTNKANRSPVKAADISNRKLFNENLSFDDRKDTNFTIDDTEQFLEKDKRIIRSDLLKSKGSGLASHRYIKKAAKKSIFDPITGDIKIFTSPYEKLVYYFPFSRDVSINNNHVQDNSKSPGKQERNNVSHIRSLSQNGNLRQKTPLKPTIVIANFNESPMLRSIDKNYERSVRNDVRLLRPIRIPKGSGYQKSNIFN